jgi:hypothetical protein
MMTMAGGGKDNAVGVVKFREKAEGRHYGNNPQ